MISGSDPIAAHLQLTLGIISEFHASLNLQEVFDNALDAVIRLTRTERAYAFLVEVDDDGAATRVGDRREVRRDFLVSAAFQGFNDQPYDEANDGGSVLLIYADGERVGGTKDDD